ncbi:uncharacterized protein LOC116661096 [Camelus ferus]|uniref:Uncharacterized protein LOC116661096 n=1 Tax=Camelus ferus TaxID=419612 RepID=A0A8B8SEF9_CAMFR|nr:uncharacterized protein LOC116661096 [Camelus ferus]
MRGWGAELGRDLGVRRSRFVSGVQWIGDRAWQGEALTGWGSASSGGGADGVWPGPGPVVVLLGCLDPGGGRGGARCCWGPGQPWPRARRFPPPQAPPAHRPAPLAASLLLDSQPRVHAAGRRTGGGGALTAERACARAHCRRDAGALARSQNVRKLGGSWVPLEQLPEEEGCSGSRPPAACCHLCCRRETGKNWFIKQDFLYFKSSSQWVEDDLSQGIVLN